MNLIKIGVEIKTELNRRKWERKEKKTEKREERGEKENRRDLYFQQS